MQNVCLLLYSLLKEFVDGLFNESGGDLFFAKEFGLWAPFGLDASVVALESVGHLAVKLFEYHFLVGVLNWNGSTQA